MDDDSLMQIGEVAEVVGLSLRTIRHYEDVGVVVPSHRSPGGFRLYREADVDRLRLVKLLKPLDFSLEEMRDLLETLDELQELRRRGEPSEHLVERVGLFGAIVEERCARLREQLAIAETLGSRLSGVERGSRARPQD